jgi:hypothetical protein
MKLFHHARLSRGLVSKEQIADWCFEGDMEKLKEHMQLSRHDFAKLMDLDAIPEDKWDKEKLLHHFLKDKKLAGEVSMSWCITLDGQWVPLPSWMQLPIFRVASEWHNSLEKWMDRKDKNFKKTGKTKLRPSQEIEYEKFVSDSLDMKIYLNKKTHVQLLSSDSKALKTQKNDVLLLRIGMSEDTTKLTLRSGNQENLQLKLMEGDAAHCELPDYFNVDAGMVTSTFFHI